MVQNLVSNPAGKSWAQVLWKQSAEESIWIYETEEVTYYWENYILKSFIICILHKIRHKYYY